MSKKVLVGGVVGFLNIVSSPGQDFVKVKARFSQVCQVVDQVIQVKDHVGQGQGQEHAKNISPLKPQNMGVKC